MHQTRQKSYRGGQLVLVIVEGHSAGCAPDAEATDADADRRHRPRVFKLLLVLVR